MKRIALLTLISLLFLTLPAFAEGRTRDILNQPENADWQLDTVSETVYQALLSNPDAMAAYEAFWAASAERDAAKANFKPSVDLTARAAYEGYRSNDLTSDYQPGEVGIAVSQMLYDGQATRNEVARLEAERQVKYFQLLAVLENTALETVDAYLDVLRYRNLLAYAEENLTQHEEIYQQVEERVSVGIDRGVDLDQARGRLALARANHRTEANNLHDVSSRFLRLVGQLPEAQLLPPTALVVPELARQIDDALVAAFNGNPAIIAAFEAVTAARSALKVRQSPLQPRLDLRAHHEYGADRDRIDGDSSETIVELVASWNIYRGCRDCSTIEQYGYLLNRAIDLREKVCRNVRQETTIAVRDINFLDYQLGFLREHAESSETAREIYRSQFEIGQRTLLDLLDTENEYFEARRAYTIASYDYVAAYASTLANMGELLEQLGLRNEEAERSVLQVDAVPVFSGDRFCPVRSVPEGLFDKGQINEQPWLK